MTAMTVEDSLSDQLALVVPTLVPVAEIYLDHEWNSRGQFSMASIVELAEDIRLRGLRDAILIRPIEREGYKYQVVYGHRRLAAHQYLNRPLIPAKVCTLPENIALELNINENLQRTDVNFYQQATGVWRLMEMGYSLDMLKRRLNQSTQWCNRRIKLKDLPKDALRLAALGVLKPQHVDKITRFPSLSSKMLFLRRLQDGHKKIESGAALADAIKKIEDKSKAKPNAQRSGREIGEMQERIQAVFGLRAPEAVALAWAAGWLSDDEFYDHLGERANDESKFFRRPEPIALTAVG